MLEGCKAWPEEFARLYREKGYWADITLWRTLEQVIADAPDKEAIITRGARTTASCFSFRADSTSSSPYSRCCASARSR
jgi:2,3-dihydroxybenzoate---[aryl-carrier protein] ligase